MKVTNWLKRVPAALLAAGISVPGAAYAIDIPLGDPSFEAFDVTGAVAGTYAYADEYNPTSAWIDDPDSPAGTTESDFDSNWLYDSTYDTSRRPTPRTGVQAMHGLDNYNGQETNAVFEADTVYTFSVWSQGDSDASGSSSRVWLYIYDGSNPFTEPSSLNFARYAPDTGDFVNRTPGSSQAESQAMWTQISISHTVIAGAPEIGSPVGVAFWGAGDAAVDDATLRADPLQDVRLFLEVNTTTGETIIRNNTGETVNIDYYEILSDGGNGDSLLAGNGNWNSLQDQGLPGFPAGNGSGNGWEEAGGSDSGVLSETYLTGNSPVANGATISLGSAFDTAAAQDLSFSYSQVVGSAAAPDSDYNGDGAVNAADYVLWRNTDGQSVTPGTGADGDNSGLVDIGDYNLWTSEFGTTGGPTGPGTLVTSSVLYVSSGTGTASVPEPTSVMLVGIGLVALVAGGRTKRR